VSGFWRTAAPVINAEGAVIKGGMFPTQRKFWDSKHFIKSYIGGYGSGKSSILCKRVIASALHNAPVPVMLVSPSYRQAKRTILPTLMSLIHGRNLKYEYNRSDAMIQIKNNGRTGHIWIGSGDTPDSLKGSNLAACYCDEAFMLPFTVIEILLSRIRDPNARTRELGLAGTPEGGLSGWAYEVLKGDRKDDFDMGMYTASTLENKALPPAFVKTLLSAYDEKTAAAYVHGKIINMSVGLIYGSFDRDIHVQKCQPPEDVQICCGIDFNYDPACAVLFWVDDDGCANYYDEVYVTGGMDTFGMMDLIWEKSAHRVDMFYPDPSGCQRKTSARKGTTDLTIIQKAGIKLRGIDHPFEVRARRRTPARKDRYNATNNAFRERKIKIDPRCKNLIRCLSLETYETFQQHAGYDHELDAFSYYQEMVNPIINKVKTMRQWYG